MGLCLPVSNLIRFSGAFGEADLVLGIITVYQVLHDTARLEEIDGLAIRKCVGQRWNAAIRIDGTKPRLFLGVFANFDLVNLVRNTVGLSALGMRDVE